MSAERHKPYIADLHIHSKYSLATSKEMDVPTLAKWAKIKGISLLGTGDFTHPKHFAEIKRALKEEREGIYACDGTDFVLQAEVSNIYRRNDKTRKVHNILFAPTFETAAKVNNALSSYGKLASDGRPILKLDCREMAKILFGIDPDIMIVPGHAWTPHFGIFGSVSGFDTPEECYGAELDNIFAIETGLSSDPAMNWRWSELDRFTLISNSDSHSPSKIGREANVFSERLDYKGLRDTLKNKDTNRFLYTVEFFPEQGKYHWDGHRACKTCIAPVDSIRFDNICPHCGSPVTIGVAHRVEKLADRKEGYVEKKSPGFKRVVPLITIISDVLGKGENTEAVAREYFRIIKEVGAEFDVLLEAPEDVLREYCKGKIAEGIINTRLGNIKISPGYDGEYGKVEIC